eukprot:5900500-Prymnesium_polylepis.1
MHAYRPRRTRQFIHPAPTCAAWSAATEHPFIDFEHVVCGRVVVAVARRAGVKPNFYTRTLPLDGTAVASRGDCAK